MSVAVNQKRLLSLDEASKELNSGKVVVLPTETVYGLAACITSEHALKSIFKTKKRPYFDPLIVHVHSVEQAKTVAKNLSAVEEHLLNYFWPGPLSLVTAKKALISHLVSAGHPTVAIRCPKNAAFKSLIEAAGPLAAPSANMFMKTSPTTLADALNGLPEHVNGVDGGVCSVGIESTILQVEEDPKNGSIHLAILRAGPISKPDFIQAMKPFNREVKVFYKQDTIAPGQLKNHYQPQAPLILISDKAQWNQELHMQFLQRIRKDGDYKQLCFSTDSAVISARELYAILRKPEAKHAYSVFTINEATLETEPWRGIKDRLFKASSFMLNSKMTLLDKDQYC